MVTGNKHSPINCQNFLQWAGRQALWQKHILNPQIILFSVQHTIISWLPFRISSLKAATVSESFLTICGVESWIDCEMTPIEQPACMTSIIEIMDATWLQCSYLTIISDNSSNKLHFQLIGVIGTNNKCSTRDPILLFPIHLLKRLTCLPFRKHYSWGLERSL